MIGTINCVYETPCGWCSKWDKKCNKKIPLGGMAWDDICWYIYDATEKDKLFTRNELADMFPDLLGHIRDK